jgi:hypothetical protein
MLNLTCAELVIVFLFVLRTGHARTRTGPVHTGRILHACGMHAGLMKAACRTRKGIAHDARGTLCDMHGMCRTRMLRTGTRTRHTWDTCRETNGSTSYWKPKTHCAH